MEVKKQAPAVQAVKNITRAQVMCTQIKRHTNTKRKHFPGITSAVVHCLLMNTIGSTHEETVKASCPIEQDN